MQIPKKKVGRKEEKRQVKFECSKEFYLRIMDEKLQRNLTLQQLAIRALDLYCGTPEFAHRGLEVIAKQMSSTVGQVSGHAIRMGIASLLQSVSPYDREETYRQSPGGLWDVYLQGRVSSATEVQLPAGTENAQRLKDLEFVVLLQAIIDFLFQLPTEKIRLVRESLALDLKYYRSARIKAQGSENTSSPKTGYQREK